MTPSKTIPGTQNRPPAQFGTMEPVDITQVSLAGEFGRRVTQIIEQNILKIDVDATFLNEFRKRGEGGYLGFGKFIDAVVRLAAGTGDPRMVTLKKRTISKLIATQEPDGYIGTVADPGMRIKALWDLHENAYIIWALVSDYQLFGEMASLKAAVGMADCLLGLFAANPDLRPDTINGLVTFWGSNLGFDRALIALGHATSNPKYTDFVMNFLKLEEYAPAIHCGPTSLANHAYTYMGHSLAQIDLYRQNGDARLLQTAKRAVEFMRKGDGMLVTGSCSDAECWHDTQNGLQYSSETCMSAYLSRIMDAFLQVEGGSIYGDIMERDVYNALFAATSPDGSRSRYFTAFDGKRRYDDFHGNRFCCANNNKRFLADLRGWIYYRAGNGVAVNLYNSSTATIPLAGGVVLRIEQETDYPTSGVVLVKIDPSVDYRFPVKLRIPRWCSAATISVNGAAPETVAGGRFHTIERTWKRGDRIELGMPMQWRFIKGRKAQAGRVAILRGPVIFTLNPERNVHISKYPDFDVRQVAVHPGEIAAPVSDDSVRPGGISCEIKAWPPEDKEPFFWPHLDRVPVVLSEFPDAGGEAIYFIVPDPQSGALIEDELVEG